MPDVVGGSLQQIAGEMLRTCRRDGQAVGTVSSHNQAVILRRLLVQLSRPTGMRVRTVLLRGAVAVVRLDADFWTDDHAIRRDKLSPPD